MRRLKMMPREMMPLKMTPLKMTPLKEINPRMMHLPVMVTLGASKMVR